MSRIGRLSESWPIPTAHRSAIRAISTPIYVIRVELNPLSHHIRNLEPSRRPIRQYLPSTSARDYGEP